MSCPVYGNRKITTALATLYIEEVGGGEVVRFFSLYLTEQNSTCSKFNTELFSELSEERR